ANSPPLGLALEANRLLVLHAAGRQATNSVVRRAGQAHSGSSKQAGGRVGAGPRAAGDRVAHGAHKGRSGRDGRRRSLARGEGLLGISSALPPADGGRNDERRTSRRLDALSERALQILRRAERRRTEERPRPVLAGEPSELAIRHASQRDHRRVGGLQPCAAGAWPKESAQGPQKAALSAAAAVVLARRRTGPLWRDGPAVRRFFVRRDRDRTAAVLRAGARHGRPRRRNLARNDVARLRLENQENSQDPPSARGGEAGAPFDEIGSQGFRKAVVSQFPRQALEKSDRRRTVPQAQ